MTTRNDVKEKKSTDLHMAIDFQNDMPDIILQTVTAWTGREPFVKIYQGLENCIKMIPSRNGFSCHE